MPRSRITSKGQITIPAVVREQLHLEVGDEVHFDVQANGTAILRTLREPPAKLFGILGDAAAGVAIEEMDPGTLDA
jgi:AbrB family looped-hinge helix DNA binding protein